MRIITAILCFVLAVTFAFRSALQDEMSSRVVASLAAVLWSAAGTMTCLARGSDGRADK